MTDAHAADKIVLCLFGLLGLLGSIGNLGILLSLLQNRSLRRVTHMLIMNQTLSDFGLCALSIPLRVLTICVRKSLFTSSLLSSSLFCRLSAGLNTGLFGASSAGLLLLTVDKFLAVKRPLRYRTGMSRFHMTTSVVLSWLVPFAMGLCGALVPQLQADLHDHSHDVACINSTTFIKSFALCVYFTTLILPLIIIFPIYVYILVKVKKSWRFLGPASTNEYTDRSLPGISNSRRIVNENAFRKKEIKLTKGIVLTLGIHLSCLTPIIALDLTHIVLHEPMPYIADEACLLILYLNAVLDPPIYTRHSKRIKRTMHSLFCACRRRDRVTQIGDERRRKLKRPKQRHVDTRRDGRGAMQNSGFLQKVSQAERTEQLQQGNNSAFTSYSTARRCNITSCM